MEESLGPDRRDNRPRMGRHAAGAPVHTRGGLELSGTCERHGLLRSLNKSQERPHLKKSHLQKPVYSPFVREVGANVTGMAGDGPMSCRGRQFGGGRLRQEEQRPVRRAVFGVPQGVAVRPAAFASRIQPYSAHKSLT